MESQHHISTVELPKDFGLKKEKKMSVTQSEPHIFLPEFKKAQDTEVSVEAKGQIMNI